MRFTGLSPRSRPDAVARVGLDEARPLTRKTRPGGNRLGRDRAREGGAELRRLMGEDDGEVNPPGSPWNVRLHNRGLSAGH